MRTSNGSLDSYYCYNQKGQLSNQSYSGYFGLYKDQNFSYNADGYLFNMTDDPASTTNTIDQFGRVTQHQLVDMNGGNTVYTTGYTYVMGGGGANATTTLVDTESISGFGSYNYSYMPNGNIYWVTVTRNGESDDVLYEYDEFGQLTSEQNRHTKQTVYYTYDAGGNITSRQTYDGVWWDFDESSLVTDTYTYGNSQWKDLLTAYNGQTITYDTIGNPLTYKNGEAMTWVGGRRLSEIDFDGCGDLLFFDYDSDGMRLRKYGPRVNEYCYSNLSSSIDYIDYYYDGGTLIYELRRTGDGDDAITGYTIEYLYGVNGIAGFNINNGTTVTTYYYVKNIMGDVIGILNSSGTLVAEYRYDAYGNPVMILDGNGNDVSTNYSHIANINPIRYRGYYYDIETGFYYLNSRYYDPEIGRFINADRYVSTGQGINGFNMFAYCGNNPVVRKDPSGQGWLSVLLVVAVVAVFTIASSSCSTPKEPIKHDVPLYPQMQWGTSCGPFCQVMIESYESGEKLERMDVEIRASQIGKEVSSNEAWTDRTWPTNISDIVFENGNSKRKLYNSLKNGPLYGLYEGDKDSHLVVITGYDMRNDKVYINDPYFDKKLTVSYNNFLNGYNSEKDMRFVCAYTYEP